MKMLIGLHDHPTIEQAPSLARHIAQLFGAEYSVASLLDSKAFLRQAQEGAFDLLAVPWSGRPGTDRLARQIVAGADVSVLVVKGEAEPLKRILVCSGGLPIARPVVQLGAQIAQAAGAQATLLHVTGPVPAMYSGLQAMEEGIAELLERDTPESQHLREAAQVFRAHDVEAALELRHGVAVDEIMAATERRDYQLLLVGASDAAPRLNRLFLGEVTSQIVERAPCSVLVVRASIRAGRRSGAA